MAKKKEKLMIIDGNALIHRSFHALPLTMTMKGGMPVNAVYGFASALLKSIRELAPDYVVLTLDAKGKTFRHDDYKEYKATRVKAPDELYAQIPLVKKLAEALSIPIFEKEGFEADDLIGTIAHKIDNDVETVIVTGDMDALQLVDGHTKVYKFGRGIMDATIFDPKNIKLHYGLSPGQVIDYKAICGDASDNIPGVKGIGAIGAKKLLEDFKDLDNIYKNIESDKITERTRQLLGESKEMAYLSRDLATIKLDVDIDFDLESARFSTIDKEKAAEAFTEFGFKSLLPRLQFLFNNHVSKDKTRAMGDAADKFERNRRDFKYIKVDSEKAFDFFYKKLKEQPEFTFDTETTSFDPMTASLLGISFSWQAGEAYYLVFDFKRPERGLNLFNYQEESIGDLHPWLRKLKIIFEDEKIKKTAHNLKFDYRVLKHNGIDPKGMDFDTMIASYLLNPGSRQYNLDALTFTELKYEKISKDDLLGRGKDRVEFAGVDTDKLSLYSCEDADFTNRLKKKLAPRLKQEKMEKLFRELEMPLVTVLAKMEEAGILIDVKALRAMGQRLQKRILSIEKMVYNKAGKVFNLKSTQQLAEVLFETLEIPSFGIAKTKSGFSTAISELEKIKDQHPVVRLLIEYRELTKLTSTYVDTLPGLLNQETKRLHTSYNQTVAATGRLSSSDPNLQNIPVRSKLGGEIRRAFVAEKGYKLVALDYSQIELRLAAHMSGDKKMIEAFKNKADIHTATAAEINQVSLQAVDENMRREAKAVNFGILYGQGPHGLSQTADIPYVRAKEFIDQYFIVYKGVKDFIDKTIKQAGEDGYVETLFSRRRPLNEINSTVAMVRKAAERMAINTPLQGTAADMIKKAMVEIDKNIKDKEVRMLLQVHDELIFEIKNDKSEKYGKMIKKIMENVIELKVPVVVDVKIGDNWDEMQKII